jgi:repressor LexA
MFENVRTIFGCQRKFIFGSWMKMREVGWAMPITPKQRRVYEFIRGYIDSNEQSPTIAEIGRYFQISSSASVHGILLALEREGLIKRRPNVSRGIDLVKPSPNGDDDRGGEIDLLGTVAAGQPIEAILTDDKIAVPPDMLGRGRTFALRVRGDSMIEDNIQDGDIIIVASQQTAENGQTVIALLDGNATVKKFYREPEFIRLQPANSQYKPMLIKTPERLLIQGVVTGLIRKYASQSLSPT